MATAATIATIRTPPAIQTEIGRDGLAGGGAGDGEITNEGGRIGPVSERGMLLGVADGASTIGISLSSGGGTGTRAHAATASTNSAGV